MSATLGLPIKIVFSVSAAAAALVAAPSASLAGHRGAVAAGVIGGVAGAMAGEAVSGALTPPAYYAPASPPPSPRCWNELGEQRPGQTYHMGQRVCE